MRTSLTRLGVNPAIGCSVHSNKVLVSVNADFFDQLNNFTSSKLNMFRTLIHPLSGARDFPTTVLQPATRIPPHPNPTTPKLQHTSKQEHTANVVIEYKSRRLLMMNALMSETC